MNNFKVVLFSVVVSLFLIITSLVIYKNFFSVQVRYIKTAELVDKYAGMKEAKDLYSQKMSGWQSNIDTLENDYRRSAIKFEAEKNKLGASEKVAQQQSLLKQESNIRAYVEQIEKLAQEEDNKMTLSVINQINQFIEEYSKKKGYDVVLGTNASGTLLYGNNDLDITQEILSELNNYYLDKK